MNATATRHFVQDLLLEEAPLGNTYRRGSFQMHNLYDGFELLPPVGATADAKDRNFTITGTGTVPTPVLLARGGVTIATRTTSAADNDEARLFPFTASNWGIAIPPASGSMQILDTLFIPTQITECQLWFGWKLTDTGVPATDADQALFYFDTDAATLNPTNLAANGNWNCITSVAGTDIAADSGVAVEASGIYRLRIAIDADRRPHFYINRKLVHVGGAMTAAANLLPSMGCASRAAAGAAKSFSVRYIRRACSI